jgi:hypothetical protein
MQTPSVVTNTHGNILLSQIRDSRNMEGYVSREQCGQVVPPGHWVPFSSPPTSRRATVEVFEPASTRTHFLTYFMPGGLPSYFVFTRIISGQTTWKTLPPTGLLLCDVPAGCYPATGRLLIKPLPS